MSASRDSRSKNRPFHKSLRKEIIAYFVRYWKGVYKQWNSLHKKRMLFPEKIQKKKKSYEQFPLGFLDKSKQISLFQFRNPQKTKTKARMSKEKKVFAIKSINWWPSKIYIFYLFLYGCCLFFVKQFFGIFCRLAARRFSSFRFSPQH